MIQLCFLKAPLIFILHCVNIILYFFPLFMLLLLNGLRNTFCFSCYQDLLLVFPCLLMSIDNNNLWHLVFGYFNNIKGWVFELEIKMSSLTSSIVCSFSKVLSFLLLFITCKFHQLGKHLRCFAKLSQEKYHLYGKNNLHLVPFPKIKISFVSH